MTLLGPRADPGPIAAPARLAISDPVPADVIREVQLGAKAHKPSRGCEGPTWVRRWRLPGGRGFGDGGGAVSRVDKGVERSGDASLLPQIEHALQGVEVVIIQHQQRL